MLTVGSLFAGIGGFDLGLERAGMRSVWQCEIDPYAQRVLEKHWPDVLRVPDIRGVNADTVPYVDVICGGFPCQDLSLAGKGAGLDGERSGLWFEYARVIGELRPRYVIVENVRALAVRGLDRVLGSLAALGYDAEWDCIPASAVGAPHQRDRIWIVAYPQRVDGGPRRTRRPASGGPREPESVRSLQNAVLGDTDGVAGSSAVAFDGRREALGGPGAIERVVGSGGGLGDQWSFEPDVGRVADGVPARVDRLRALGNALVPQVAEWIGRRIVEWEGDLDEVA